MYTELQEGCSDSDDLAAWNVSEADNPDLARLCKAGSASIHISACSVD